MASPSLTNMNVSRVLDLQIKEQNKRMVDRKIKFRKGVRKTSTDIRREKYRRRRLTIGEPIQFPITDDKLSNFTRMIQKPKDCVINAFQILGLVDSRSAEIMRIAVGETGLTEGQIEQVFNFVLKSRYKFVEDKDRSKLNDYVINTLKPGHVVFFGIKYSTEFSIERHVFLIGKYLDGRLVYIDPQSADSGCILNEGECYNKVFGNVISYYILLQD